MFIQRIPQIRCNQHPPPDTVVTANTLLCGPQILQRFCAIPLSSSTIYISRNTIVACLTFILLDPPPIILRSVLMFNLFLRCIHIIFFSKMQLLFTRNLGLRVIFVSSILILKNLLQVICNSVHLPHCCIFHGIYCFVYFVYWW